MPDKKYHNDMLTAWQTVWNICMPVIPGSFEYNWNGMDYDHIEPFLKLEPFPGSLPMFFPIITFISAPYDSARNIYFFLFPQMFRYIRTLYSTDVLDQFSLSDPWKSMRDDDLDPDQFNHYIVDVLGGESNEVDYQATYQRLFRQKSIRWFPWSCPTPSINDKYLTIQSDYDFGDTIRYDCHRPPFDAGMMGSLDYFESTRAGLHGYPESPNLRAYYISFFERFLIEAFRKEIQTAPLGTPFIDRFPLDRVGHPNNLMRVRKMVTTCLGTKIYSKSIPSQVFYPYLNTENLSTYMRGVNEAVIDEPDVITNWLHIKSMNDRITISFNVGDYSSGDILNPRIHSCFPQYILPRTVLRHW